MFNKGENYVSRKFHVIGNNHGNGGVGVRPRPDHESPQMDLIFKKFNGDPSKNRYTLHELPNPDVIYRRKRYLHAPRFVAAGHSSSSKKIYSATGGSKGRNFFADHLKDVQRHCRQIEPSEIYATASQLPMTVQSNDHCFRPSSEAYMEKLGQQVDVGNFYVNPKYSSVIRFNPLTNDVNVSVAFHKILNEVDFSSVTKSVCTPKTDNQAAATPSRQDFRFNRSSASLFSGQENLRIDDGVLRTPNMISPNPPGPKKFCTDSPFLSPLKSSTMNLPTTNNLDLVPRFGSFGAKALKNKNENEEFSFFKAPQPKIPQRQVPVQPPVPNTGWETPAFADLWSRN